MLPTIVQGKLLKEGDLLLNDVVMSLRDDVIM